MSVVPTTPRPVGNPCEPSPCGPYSQCRVVGSTPACSCLQNYVGRAPNCRPECTMNAECPSNLACNNERCVDPCLGACGHAAICRVVNHGAVCTCPQGFIGDPATACQPEPPSSKISYLGLIIANIILLLLHYSLFCKDVFLNSVSTEYLVH